MNLIDLFQANFYFKVALQPYISVVSSFFQEATGIDLASSIVLCFFQTSTYSHPFFHRYWVIWRHHLQPSIFSMIVSLFHASTWSNPHVKETFFYFTILFATIDYNKRSAVDSRKSWRVCLFEESNCSPALLKVAIYSTEQVAIIFAWKVVKCTRAFTEIRFFHGEPA